MREINCWKLEAVCDPGCYIFIGYFDQKPTADEAKKLTRGSYRPEVSKCVLRIWDNAIEMAPHIFDLAGKAAALGKLTDYEKKLLGL